MEKPKVEQLVFKQPRNRGANEVQIGGTHYKKHVLEHWDTVALFDLDYFQGVSWKYIMRWRDKGGIPDLEKAGHVLQKYIEVEKARVAGTLTRELLMLAIAKLDELDAQEQQAEAYRAQARGDDPKGDFMSTLDADALRDGRLVVQVHCTHGKVMDDDPKKDEFCEECQRITHNTELRIVKRDGTSVNDDVGGGCGLDGCTRHPA